MTDPKPKPIKHINKPTCECNPKVTTNPLKRTVQLEHR